MRIALVSPYSWTYPGGVTRHIEALAEQYLATGHDVRVLSPVDPPGRLSTRLHAGAQPAEMDLPEYLIPLGRTIGIPSNGAVSNLSAIPYGISVMRKELRTGGYDVVHIHEPVAPAIGWDALCSSDLPLVGTFHCYSENKFSNNTANLLGARRRLNHLHERIAVSEAAAWTGKRFYGGRYRIIPNGVHVPEEMHERAAGLPTVERPLRLAFVGQAVERKGLPVLLRAFEALRDHVPVRLDIVGVTAEQLEPLMLDARGVYAHGKCSDEHKKQVLRNADLLCAPSLGGESFGMVLTEGFAAGTPVVASDIAGYRDVVEHGVDGVLFPRGDATALAETLRDLALDPERRAALGAAAASSAQDYAWPRVASQILETYESAMAAPAPVTMTERALTTVGLRPADGAPREPARRLPSLEPELAVEKATGRGTRIAKKAGVAFGALLATALVVLAMQRVGFHEIKDALLAATPIWVFLGLGVMCASMILRAVAWHAILQAALPTSRVKRFDAVQGTCIGVLMSATLPARLGEPSRALIVARRIGGARENLPRVVGSIVSQTLLNVVALVVLGIAMFSTVDVFSNNQALLAFTIGPMAILAVVLIAPALLRKGKPSRFRRVADFATRARSAMVQVRAGLQVFRNPRLGGTAAFFQLSAWALQWLSCYLLLIAFGLEHEAGLGAAAAVLFAVNITAVLPATPSNLGVFQAACVAVLTAYGVSNSDALAYGIMLQAVEIATAVIMGAPALVKEGLSWKDVRMRAMHASPVKLEPLPQGHPARQRTGEFISPNA